MLDAVKYPKERAEILMYAEVTKKTFQPILIRIED